MANPNQSSGSVLEAGLIIGNPIVETHFHGNSNPEPKSICFQVDVTDINFVGRASELDRLKNATINDPNQRAQIIIVVSGLGGIGKTQLVREFIHQNRSSYNHIIWINSDKRGHIEEDFKTLAKRLSIPTQHEGSNRKFDIIAQEVLNRLSASTTLMVFDNVDEKDNCNFVFRMGTLGDRPHVIITSRIQEWSDSICLIKLKVFESTVAVDYISKTLINPNKKYKDSAEDKTTLAEKLQNFPLALKQATAHINHRRKKTSFHIADYIDNYNTQAMLDSTLFQNDICNTYAQTTFNTWRVTIHAIKQNRATGDLAHRILNIIAFFNPDHIRRDIFYNLRLPDPSLKKVEIEENVMSAVELLVNYSMVDSQEEQSVLSIHRLVQDVIKFDLECGGITKTIVLRDSLGLVKNYENFQEIYEHGILAFVSALTFIELVEEFSTFPKMILDGLNDCWKYSRAIDFGNQILHHLTCILGDDHRDTLLSKFNIARSYENIGEHSKALKIFEEVFEKEKLVFGDDHPETLNCQSNIALVYLKLGELSIALRIDEEVFEKRKQIFGNDHATTLISKFNIANLYHKLGENSTALRMFEEVFEREKQFFWVRPPRDT